MDPQQCLGGQQEISHHFQTVTRLLAVLLPPDLHTALHLPMNLSGYLLLKNMAGSRVLHTDLAGTLLLEGRGQLGCGLRRGRRDGEAVNSADGGRSLDAEVVSRGGSSMVFVGGSCALP